MDFHNPLGILGDPIVGHSYIYLLHDSTGKILSVLNPGNIPLRLVIEELQEHADLKLFFSLPDLSGLAAGEIRVGGQIKNFKWNPNLAKWTTALPLSSLETKRLDAGTFLGRISFNTFIGNILTRSVNAVLLIDVRNDALLGFNDYFFRFFEKAYGSPSGLLHRPAGDFFSPTPLDIQRAALPDFDPAAVDRFGVLYQKDFSLRGADASEEISHAARFDPTPEGIRWKSADPPGSFLTLLKPLDTRLWNFMVTAIFVNGEGRGLSFVLGERYTDAINQGLDVDGYLTARAPNSPNYVLKRQTFVTTVAPDPGLPAGEVLLQFCKVGTSLFVFQNGRRLLAYSDDEFLHREKAYLSVGLRPGYDCLLKRMDIRTWSCGAPGREPPSPIVRLHGGPETCFTINRFYSSALSNEPFFHAGGFMLNNVTPMQERIDDLDRRYRKLLGRQARENEAFIGNSVSMARLREKALAVAESTATVLIEGPTGAGKEALANYLHSKSGRAHGPFVKVDCSTVPESLMESHLFGHEKGAFTGAVAQVKGVFEQAEGGTLFMDEVGNLTPSVQSKLLQFFNDFTVTRLGGTSQLKLNVRCIVASNTPLSALVSQGLFREDLYYRMSVVRLAVPPLHERKEDLPALCGHFLAVFERGRGKKIKGFAAGAMEKIRSHRWPGNVRELSNAIQGAVIFCQGDLITPELIQFQPPVPAPAGLRPRRRHPGFHLSLTPAPVIEGLLRKHGGRVTRVAAELGVSRIALYHYLKRKKIDAGAFKKGFESS